MMVFRRRPLDSKNNKTVGVIVAIVTAVSVASGGLTNSLAHRGQTGGDIGSVSTMLLFAGMIALPIIIFVIVRFVRNAGDDAPPRDDAASDLVSGATNADSSAVSDDDSDDNNRRALMFGLLAALIAIGMALFAYASTAHAQDAADRGTLYIRHGADTVVTDHFAWVGDSLRGRSQLKGQGAVEYFAIFGPRYELRTITYDLYPATAKAGAAPATHLVFTMQNDTIIAEVPSGVERVPTRHGAIPMMEICSRSQNSSFGAPKRPVSPRFRGSS